MNTPLDLLNHFLRPGISEAIRQNLIDTIENAHLAATGKKALASVPEAKLIYYKSLFIDGEISPDENKVFADLLSQESDGPLTETMMEALAGIAIYDGINDAKRISASSPDELHDEDCTCGCNDLPDNYYDLILPADIADGLPEERDAGFEHLARLFLDQEDMGTEERIAFISFLGYDLNKDTLENDTALEHFSLRYLDHEGSRGHDYLFRLVLAFLADDLTDEEYVALRRYLGYVSGGANNDDNIRQTQRIIACVNLKS